MSEVKFQDLLNGLVYAAPRWAEVFDADKGPYNALTGDRYESVSRLLLAPVGVRTYAQSQQVNAHGLTVLGEPVDVFSVRLESQKPHRRYVVPYRRRTLFPVVAERVLRRPRVQMPTDTCERALAKYGVTGALRKGYEEFALRALVGYVADEKIGDGCARREFIEEITATWVLNVFGYSYDAVRDHVIVDTSRTVTPLEFAHDVATVNATIGVVMNKLGVKR